MKRFEFGFGVGKTVAMMNNVNNGASFMTFMSNLASRKSFSFTFCYSTAGNYNKRTIRPSSSKQERDRPRASLLLALRGQLGRNVIMKETSQ